MQQGQAAPELCIAIELASGLPDDARPGVMRSIIDRAGAEAGEVAGLLFTVVDDVLRPSLEGGAGQVFFPLP